MKSSILILILILMTIIGAVGGVYFKLFSSQKKKVFFFVGVFFYGIGAILNIVLLKFLPYTVVFPANALTYIWALLFAALIFKEKIGRLKILGVLFIFLGTVFLVI